ncbi:MAG: hypothetical protein OHK0045_12520 [Raineya sp.]
MFSDLFISSKNKKHLANLLNLAKADGFFHLNEYEFLLVVARKYGLSADYLQKMQKENKDSSYILPKNNLERFLYWYDLMNMVLADNIIHEKEIEYCKQIAKVFGYKPEAVILTLKKIQEGQNYEGLYAFLKEKGFLTDR